MKPSSILLFLAAALLGFGALSTHWFGAHESFVGPLRMTRCYEDECHTDLIIKYLFKGSGRDLIPTLLALACGVLGLVSAVIAGITAISTLNGKRGAAFAVVITAPIGAAAGLVFFVLALRGETSPSYGLASYYAGVALAITGAVLAMKQFPRPRPMMMMMPGMSPMGMMPPMGMQPGYMPQPPQMQTPPCNQCGGQTQFAAQYGKLFCGRCNRYLV